MAQTTQADSAEKSLATLKSVLFHEIHVLDPLCDRLSFIMDNLCAKHDWIQDSAATGLYFTLESIHDDLKASHDHITKAWKQT